MAMDVSGGPGPNESCTLGPIIKCSCLHTVQWFPRGLRLSGKTNVTHAFYQDLYDH
jgi:hypothetical protein